MDYGQVACIWAGYLVLIWLVGCTGAVSFQSRQFIGGAKTVWTVWGGERGDPEMQQERSESRSYAFMMMTSRCASPMALIYVLVNLTTPWKKGLYANLLCCLSTYSGCI